TSVVNARARNATGLPRQDRIVPAVPRTVAYGAHTLPSCTGSTRPRGETSNPTSSVNAPSTTVTVSGKRRRTARPRHATACRTSSVQASGPGSAGHQDPPTRVTVVSTTTNPTAMATSIATRCPRYHSVLLTPATGVALWVAQVAAALLFASAALGKLTGSPEARGIFDAMGVGAWF